MPKSVALRNRYLTPVERAVIIRAVNRGLSQKDVADVWNVSKSTISRVVNDVSRVVIGTRTLTTDAESKAAAARNAWMLKEMRKVKISRATTVEMEHATLTSMLAKLKKHRKVVSGEWQMVTKRQAARIMHAHGWRYMKRPKVVAHTEAHVAKRHAFAQAESPRLKAVAKEGDAVRLDKAHYDESLFQLHAHTQDGAMWTPPGEVPHNRVATRTSGKDKVMVYAFLWRGGVEVFFHEEEGSVVTGTMIKEAFEPVKKLLKKEKLKVYCDNASQHRSKEMKAWLEKNKIEMIFGPPLSPDLNPIELFFGALKAAVGRRHPRDVGELKRFILEETEQLRSKAKAFCEKFPSAVEQCLKNKGMPGNKARWGIRA